MILQRKEDFTAATCTFVQLKIRQITALKAAAASPMALYCSALHPRYGLSKASTMTMMVVVVTIAKSCQLVGQAERQSTILANYVAVDVAVNHHRVAAATG